MDLQLGDKLALVTASPGDVGFAVARAMAAEGARIIAEVSGAEVRTLVADAGTAEGCEPVVGAFPEVDVMDEDRPASLIARPTHPAEIADLVAFVCNSRASAINGAALRVDGGLVRSIL